MSADGVINIDILLGKKQEFLNDIQHIDQLLSKLGALTGEKMDDSFSEQAKGLKTEAKETKEKVDETFNKPIKFKLKADNTEANKEITSTKDFLKGIPKEKITKLKADNTQTEVKFKKTKESLDEIPEKKQTKIDADTNSAEKNIDELNDKVEESSKGFLGLKDVIKGTFVGTLAASGMEKISSSFSGWISQICEAQDANIKLKNTLELSEKQAKSYAAVTRGLFTSGFVDSIDDASEVVKELNIQLGNLDSGQMTNISRYAVILRDQFGMDLSESLRGVNSLMTNFGVDAETAFDYMVKGAQQGLDKTDELGDNLAEYGQIWSQAGFNAKDMFAILENGLKSGAYNLDKVNDFVKEFSISLNDGRIEKNIGNFSAETQNLFSQFKDGKATASDMFKVIISDLKNTTNEQDKLATASTIWSALGEDNAMKVIESLGDVNTAFDDVSGSAEKTVEETEKSFGIRFKNNIRKVAASLIPVGNKILDIAEKYIPSVGEVSGKVFSGLWKSVDKVCSYLDSHKGNIEGILTNGKIILGIVADTAWGTFKDILSLISSFLGDTNKNGDKAKDPLQQIDDILKDLADHKEDIERLTKALMAMWATKKIFGFISAVKEAKKVLMELKAVELITGDGGLLNFKGFKLGKGAKAAEELGEGAEAAKAATKLGKVGEFAAGGLKTAGRGIAGLDVLLSLTELIGMNKQNAGKKVGAAAGSLGGVVAGGVAGATFGSVVPVVGTAVGGAIGSAVGALGGTEIGKKLGGAIQSGLKTKGPGIKKTVGQFFSGKLGWEQSLGKAATKAVSSMGKGLSGAKKTVTGVFSSIGKNLAKVFLPFKKLFSSLGKSITKVFLGAKKTVTGVFNSIGKTISQWVKSIKRTLSPIGDFIVHVFKTAFWLIYGPIKLVFQEIEKLVKKFVKWISPYLSKAWNGIKKTAKKVWTAIGNVFSSFAKTVKKILKALSSFISGVWKDIQKGAKTAWKIIEKYIVNPVEDAFNGVKKFLGKIWDHAVIIFERLGHFVRKTWDKIKHDIITPVETALEPVEKAAKGIFHSIEKWFGKVWDKVTTVFGDIVNAATDLPKNIGKAISGGIDFVLSAFKDIANTMIGWIAKGVNGVLHGINWVLKKVHAPKDVLWDDWKPKKFAKGTNGKTTESQLAIINDAPGNDYQEIVLHPDGNARVYEGRDRLTYLPKGSEVLEGSKSKDLMKMLPFPKYAEGTGKGLLSTMWEKAKDIGEDVADFVEHPQDLLMSAVKKFTKIDGAVSPYLDIAKGGVSYLVDKVKDWFSDMVKSFSDSGGSGARGQFLKIAEAQGDKPYVWGAEGPNAFDCSGLVKWALGQVGISFPHYSGDQFSMTQPISESEAKPGDLAFYGPGGDEHVGIVTGKNKMFAAQSPSSNPNIGPDSIHNGLPFSGIHRIRQLTDGGGSANNPAGSGVNRWIPIIKQAARTMHVSLSDTMLHTILGLIQGESGGNASVNQQITDVNSFNGSGGAKGLIQFIQSTFDAYKMPGHGNIYSGYDQLLALFNDSNWQTDIHPYGGWGPSGRRRYANGGWADKASIFGEVPGQPEVAINPKRDSADRLINEAIEARAKEAPNSVSAKIAGILHSAKQGAQSFLPECQFSGHAVKNILHSGETDSNGDLVVIVELDNGEIFKAQYPLHKAMQVQELVIEQAKAGM